MHEGQGASLRYSTGHCVQCTLEMRRRHYATNDVLRAKQLARRAALRIKNREHEQRQMAEYREKNRLRLREKSRERYRADPKAYGAGRDKELRRKYDAKYKREMRRRQPERTRLYTRSYFKANNVKIALRNRLWRAFKAYAESGKQYKTKLYGIDLQAIIVHLGPCPGPRNQWHIDHIRPLSSFDFDDPIQVKEAFAPENHQWLPARENLMKNKKYAPRVSR